MIRGFVVFIYLGNNNNAYQPMPFTFAHPAIVLPFSCFSQRWASVTALIIGSMVPDFEYFLRMQVKSVYSHTWWGLFCFDLPLGLLLLLIYQLLVKDVLIDHLPTSLNRRFSNFKRSRLPNFAVIFLCILIGGASHILWDGFTHPTGYFVQAIPVLSNTVAIGTHHFFLYKILQQCSTIAGLAYIGMIIYKFPQGELTKRVKISDFWLQVFSIAVLTLFIKMAAAQLTNPWGTIVVVTISGLFIGLICASAITKFKTN